MSHWARPTMPAQKPPAKRTKRLLRGTFMSQDKGIAREVAVGIVIAVLSPIAVAATGWIWTSSLSWLVKSIQVTIWLAAVSVTAACLAVWLLGLWMGFRRGTRAAIVATTSASAPVGFTPSDEHIAVIEALRRTDDAFQSNDEIRRYLARSGRSMPSSDVRHLLEDLTNHNWAESYLDIHSDENWYRLAGKGTQFARERGISVLET